MKDTITRRRFGTAAGSAAAAFALPAWAQPGHKNDWPTRAVRIVVPFPPGGTTDFVTRLVTGAAAQVLGQPVVVENKPGAGTVIGVNAVAQSAADGYSFVTVANSFTVNPTLLKELPYDTLGDLRPVALMGMSEHALVTHPGSGLRSLADLQRRAKQEAFSYGSFGIGTSAHLAGEDLKLQTGLDLLHAPYKGQAPALTDLLGGQITLLFCNWPECRQHIQEGRLLALGMATQARSAYAPDIPTLGEQGISIVSNSWNGILAPKAVADTVVQRLNQVVNQALASDKVRAAFAQGGIASLACTPEDFDRFIRAEMDKYAAIIRRAKITTG